MPDVGYTEERNRLFLFSSKYLVSDHGEIITNKKLNISAWEQCAGLRVTLHKGNILNNNVNGFMGEVKARDINVNIKYLNSLLDVLKAVNTNEADIGVVNSYIYEYWSEIFKNIKHR